jgi:hypothetical protein
MSSPLSSGFSTISSLGLIEGQLTQGRPLRKSSISISCPPRRRLPTTALIGITQGRNTLAKFFSLKQINNVQWVLETKGYAVKGSVTYDGTAGYAYDLYGV